MNSTHQSPLSASNHSRRTVLRGMAGALSIGPFRFRFAAQDELLGEAAPGSRRPTLVTIFLRGGADGLNLVVPHGDEDYYRLRKGLAIPRPGESGGALDIDGRFGFHPSGPGLHQLQQEGVLAALHGVGHPENTRSHFEEQDRWEIGGSIPKGERQAVPGWLNRYLASVPARGPVRAISLGHRVARSLRGGIPALAVPSLDALGGRGSTQSLEASMRALEKSYGTISGLGSGEDLAGSLLGGGTDALEALRTLSEVASTAGDLKGQYPEGSFGVHCREAARLIRADLGVEIISINLEGFDTHQNQAQPLAVRTKALSEGLAALRTDLAEHLDDVLVLTVSEFGRTARGNGTRGTDHGSGSCMLAMGGTVRAGSIADSGSGTAPVTEARDVLGDWPTLALDALQDRRDLRATTDIRNVYAEVVTNFLGLKNLQLVLPGWQPTPVGLIGKPS